MSYIIHVDNFSLNSLCFVPCTLMTIVTEKVFLITLDMRI